MSQRLKISFQTALPPRKPGQFTFQTATGYDVNAGAKAHDGETGKDQSVRDRQSRSSSTLRVSRNIGRLLSRRR
jgi:hypothetical protein